MYGWKTILSYWEGNFSGGYVKLRGCIDQPHKLPSMLSSVITLKGRATVGLCAHSLRKVALFAEISPCTILSRWSTFICVLYASIYLSKRTRIHVSCIQISYMCIIEYHRCRGRYWMMCIHIKDILIECTACSIGTICQLLGHRAKIIEKIWWSKR